MDGLYDEVRAGIHAVWQRRWLALGIAWGLCLAGWLVVSQIPNQYVSTARIDVQLRSILPAQDGSVARNEQEKDIERVRQTLTSAVNLKKVVLSTDLANTVSSDQDIANRVAALQKAIKITPQQDNIFEISATIANAGASDATNAKLARDVVQKLIDIFVEDNLANNRGQTSQSLRFLDQQLDQRQQALQAAETKKADFQTRFLGSLPGTGTIADRVGQARTQLAQVNADLAAAQSSLGAVNGQMAGTPRSTPGAAGVSGPARARLAAIQGQLAEARGRGWTDSHPDVIALNSQLAQAQAAAGNEPLYGGGGGASNPLYLSLQAMQADRAAQVASLSQRKAQLEGDLGRLSDTMANEPGVAGELAAIDRDYLVLKDQYDKLLTSREQVRLRSQVQTETDAVKFAVIDPPTRPQAPAAPNRPLFLTAILILGLGGGAAAAFAMSKLRTTYPTAARLEKASGLPVIGSIGEVVTAAQTAIRKRQLRMFAGGVGGLVVAFVVLIGVEFLQRGLVA
ncbi:XrtA system polysaccharide chain length determinant [Sphingomonas qomolangmaensis]|uniref:Chain-length determining protein n=1 Tax=Sphingomonas qomolangmaensis TaxID=2918765 RepID=A0ABY5L8D4_9SPHN|nr:XrtA system polysaccharide chain length determinant [Sphingomonas qomolangmaensis]UUL83233.1 chain-length determining protein [Sphingomonas qomolangmaensis]